MPGPSRNWDWNEIAAGRCWRRRIILHAQPYRDTSRILEVFTREQGRVSMFARGVRGPKARLASLLQPFQPLLLSFSSRGEAAQLMSAESDAARRPVRLPAGRAAVRVLSERAAAEADDAA